MRLCLHLISLKAEPYLIHSQSETGNEIKIINIVLAKSCHLPLGWSIGVNFCHIIAKMAINSVISAIAKIAPATATLAINPAQRNETVIKKAPHRSPEKAIKLASSAIAICINT